MPTPTESNKRGRAYEFILGSISRSRNLVASNASHGVDPVRNDGVVRICCALMSNLLVQVAQRAMTKASRMIIQALSFPTAGPPLVRLGSVYGGWWIPADGLGPDSVCYLAGVGEDASFDLALIERFGCVAWAFDPTPRSIAYVASISEPRFHFLPVGLWRASESRRFYAPGDPNHVSHSAINSQRTAKYFEADCKNLVDLMAQLNHTRIDLLKMDIEGAEGAVLDHMLTTTIRPRVLCIEFDAPELPWTTLGRIARLRRAGYVLRHVERRNYTFTFPVPGASPVHGESNRDH